MVFDIVKEIELDISKDKTEDFLDNVQEMLDNDEITPVEAAFMQGWEEAG